MAANKLRILAARGPKQRKGRQAVAPWPRAPVASGRIPECEIDADGAAPSLQDLPTTIRWLPSLSDPTGATLGGEVAAWLNSLEQADAEGVFQNGAVVFTVVGQKP